MVAIGIAQIQDRRERHKGSHRASPRRRMQPSSLRARARDEELAKVTSWLSIEPIPEHRHRWCPLSTHSRHWRLRSALDPLRTLGVERHTLRTKVIADGVWSFLLVQPGIPLRFEATLEVGLFTNAVALDL